MRADRTAYRSAIGPVVIFVIGVVLMVGKIYADSEPGAIPLLLVVVGVGWYLVTRFRGRSRHK
jgi:hypothetical protein